MDKGDGSTLHGQDIDVVELLRKTNAYHVSTVSKDKFEPKAGEILTVWSRCAITAPHSSTEFDSLDPVFNTLTNQILDAKNLITSLTVKKNFKDYAIDSLKRYHALHDIMSSLPGCLKISSQTLNIPPEATTDFKALIKIARNVTSRLILMAVTESMNDDSQRYFGNFIRKNDLPVPLSYYKFNVNTDQIEYVINFNLITEILCLTDDRILLQMGSPSTVEQGKSSLLPYMCLDKRHECINTAGNASLRAGCVDVLSGTIQSKNEVQQVYTIFDVHGTVQNGLNHDLIRTIQYYAAVLIFYITLDDLESDVMQSILFDIGLQPTIFVVFDQEFDDRDVEDRLKFHDECKKKLKPFLPSTSTPRFYVLSAPYASVWQQKSDSRDFDEENRGQLLRQSFSDAFVHIESAITQQKLVFRSCFMIQSRFLSCRSVNAPPNADVSSFTVEKKSKQWLEKYTDQTDNLRDATPIVYLQGKIRAAEKQLIRQTDEDMTSLVAIANKWKTELNRITSVSALTKFFIEILTQRTFVELLILDKYLEKWRSQYQPSLLIEMSEKKERAINLMDVIKKYEAEEQAIVKQSLTDQNVAAKRAEILENLKNSSTKLKEVHDEMEVLENKLMNVDLTIGLLLDEITAIVNFNPRLLDAKNPETTIDKLAICFVNLMNRGIALHILRGRPLECPSSLLSKSIQIAGRNARSPPFVVCVVGEQSSAKSSLLNTCFGTNFRVSSGRCTIGVYLSVVHWEDLTVVILDTEGLLSVEEASALFDNQIVTMAMLSSHVTIINHKGEFSTTLGSLIGMSLYAKTKLEANMKPTLLFILRDQSDTSDEAKRKHFFPQLTTLKQALQTDANFLTTSLDDILEINSNAVMLLSNAIVKDIDKRSGIKQTYRNRSFPIEIQEVRRIIHGYLESYRTNNIYKDFDNMSLVLASNWSVIDQLGPDLLSCKTLMELRRMTEVQTIALDILKPAASSLNEQLDNLVENMLKSHQQSKMTMESMNNAITTFRNDVEKIVADVQDKTLDTFATSTAKSYFSIDVTEKWKRTIISSLKNLTEQYNHIFEERLQTSCHEKIAKEVEDTLIATAEKRFNQDKSTNVEQLRIMMKAETDQLRKDSQENLKMLFAQSSVITEKIVRLYDACLQLQKNKRSRAIHDMLPSMPPSNFISYSDELTKVVSSLEDFVSKTTNKVGKGQRLGHFLGLSTELDKMWAPIKNKAHWFTSSDAASNRKILVEIFCAVLPKLKSELCKLVKNDHPIYNKMKVMEEAIDKIEEVMSLREITDQQGDLNRNALVSDLAVIALRVLVEESIRVDTINQREKVSELNARIKRIEESVERQIASMKDASKQGYELASTVAEALFIELKRIMITKITHDMRQAVINSDSIVHENIQKQAYNSSFMMSDPEKILKYVTNINRYFLEISLDSIRAVFVAMINDQTAKLESLINTMLVDIHNAVDSNECKNYAEVNKIIVECAQKSFTSNTNGYIHVTFEFPAAMSMGIPNSALFKSAFRRIFEFSSKVPDTARSIIDSLRGAAFKECLTAITRKLGCQAQCPGCGAKCAVIGDHIEEVISRSPRAGHGPPPDADAKVKIHNTTFHLAECLHGGSYHGTRKPVLYKCYQNWTTAGIQLNENEVVRPVSLYYNHFHPSWFKNLDEMSRTANDRQSEHAALEQRRGWMFVRKIICDRHKQNDYSDEEYEKMAEPYPKVNSLPIDFSINWKDSSL